MKKVISVLVTAALLLSSLAVATFAQEKLTGKCGENMTWTLDLDSGELVISGEGRMFEYSYYVDAGEEGWWDTVTEKPSQWETHSAKIKTVIIEDGVTNIGYSAFRGFANLTSVTIPGSVTRIDSDAFPYLYGNSVKNVYYTGNLAGWCEIEINQYSEYSAENLYINNKLVEGDIVIPEGVESIGSYTFKNLDGIESVKIPGSVTSVGAYAFSGCDSLMSVTFKDSPASIGACAFSGCDSLVKVTLGNAITDIGNYAFNECVSLTGISIPDSTVSIGERAFYNCSSIRPVSIGKGVTEIGEYAFYGCYSATEITVSDENKSYSSDEYGVLFNEYKTELIQYPAGNKRTSYTVPDSVTNIMKNAFENADCLESVTIGKRVNAVGNVAFRYCDKLKSIDIPDNVKSIGVSAFYECTSLESVIIGNGVTSIGDYAFEDCRKLKTVTLGNRIRNIGSEAFYCCYLLESIVIPDSVRTIDSSSFACCDSLNSVTIGSGITNISKGLFAGCYGIKSITIPATVKSISYSAFSECNNITDVYYEGTEEMWSEVLIAANNGTILDATVHFGNEEAPEIQSCGENLVWTFYAESGELEISGEGDMYDFSAESPAPWNEYSDEIKKVTIESGVTSIGDNAFESCSAITYTAFKGTSEQWNAMDNGEGNDALSDGVVRYGEKVVSGDIDGDENINSSDALYCLRNSVQSIDLVDDALLAADVTGDFQVNSSDALRILQYSVGTIEKL